LPAEITKPSHNGLSAATNAGASDAAIFFEWALHSHRPNADSAASVFLEEQLIARLNAKGAPNFVRHCNLTFARDSRMLLHR
jgi:hypothetical protein